jgi:hypothetical protein
MKKIMVACVVLFLMASGDLLAQRSGGSSGSSRPSSGSSFGGSSRPSSGSSSGGSSGSKYSSGSPSASSGSKSYSSGSPSKSTPSASSGSKNYSSGNASGSKYSSTPPAATSPSASSGSKNYSSGKPSSSPPPSGAISGSGSKYSSGTPPPSASSNFNASLSDSAKKQESKVAYQKATAPKSTFTTSTGQTVSIKPNDKKVETIRTITNEQYVTRNVRVTNFYGPTYGSPIPQSYSVFQHDPLYNVWFWMWLTDRNRCPSSDYYDHCYNHRNSISDSEWKELVKKDAQLEAKMEQMEKERKGVRDESYRPAQFKDNPDLMYTDSYVDASINPVPVTPVANPVVVADTQTEGGSYWWIVWTILGGVLIGLVVYYFFFRDF